MIRTRRAAAAVAVIFGFLPCALAQKATPHFIGAGGCSSANCHGSTTPAPENSRRILTTEYAMWAIHDKHADAGKVLETPRSARITEILGLGDATAAKRCTACHVAGSPENSPNAGRSDGVACEACHGAAEKWLGTHTQANSHAASLEQGMIDTRDPVVRAKMCLECHLGTATRYVDHAMIAAGHPDLPFELDTFWWAEPSHARPEASSPGNTLPRAREWAVGESVALARQMNELARRAETSWPDFATLECSQCHHDLRSESWRIQRGYAGRAAGSLQVNPANASIVRVLAAQTAPGSGPAVKVALDSALDALAATAAHNISDGPEIAKAARNVERQADILTSQVRKTDFTRQMATDLVRAFVADINRISGDGVSAAEQATMSLDSLSAALSVKDERVQKSMDELYLYLEHPSAYNARDFAALFRKIAHVE